MSWFLCGREYLVDLIGKPGHLCEPSSLLNGPLSISISSPLRFPRLKPSDPTIDFRSLAKQYFTDCQMLDLVFDDPSTGYKILPFWLQTLFSFSDVDIWWIVYFHSCHG